MIVRKTKGMIRAIIVDDEQWAIDSLKWELEKFCPEVDVLETFTNPLEAIHVINTQHPDCVFLDIEMPEVDGFQLLKKLEYRRFDLVITTAYSQYAIEAFKENAVNYLLKPIDPEDLINTVNRIKQNRESKKLGQNFETALKNIIQKNSFERQNRVPLALADKVVMVSVQDIMYCKADGNYTHVFMQNGKKFLLSKTIKNFSESLHSDLFLRVHKSFIVNTNFIEEYTRGDGGELLMTNKQKIPVSRTHKEELLHSLQIK